MALAWAIALLGLGCDKSTESATHWGVRGVLPGQLMRPRALAAGGHPPRIYVVDFTARIQVFTPAGQYIAGWATPESHLGKPSGISLSPGGEVLVADSHYGRILVYSADGQLVRWIGAAPGSGTGPFDYVSDVVQDAEGYYYVAECGETDRICKLSPTGQLVTAWGGRGSALGQLARPRGLCLGPDGLLYVADACNHRVQVFDRQGHLVRIIGRPGHGAGELMYPYDVALSADGDVYVVEYGNHRVQRFAASGISKRLWGSPGRTAGQLASPWGLCVAPDGTVFVADTENHRIVRVPE